ncbi:phosphopyruvate hydratase [Halocatena marina]|uniref:phosphopyruvate hydratase n=1 Tax=Halocatena marina TaxID=2934937 RepID=UPI00200C391D|nr:phosphopyruvate hydratase [Halocatena marina]
MTLITEIRLRKVLDSRGNATVEADVSTESGGFGRASAPSGASTGEYEAIELPADEAIAQARSLAIPRLEGQVYAGDQRSIDRTLREADETDNFGEIGANSAVAISMAAAKAGADMLGAPLYQHLGGAFRGGDYPTPLGNAIGGGEHATGGTDIQEFLAAPVGAPSVSDAVFANARVHQAVHDILSDRGISAEKSDEGAWSPSIADSEAFEIMAEATETVSEEMGFEISFGIDAAASELFDGGKYHYSDTSRTTDEQIEYVADLVTEYGLVYVEDPLEENDYDGFEALTERVGDQTLVCGDDLFVTNTDRLTEGIEQDAANSILIKPNQIGTLTDAFDAVELAVENGYAPVISHRSGETEDTTIAHLAVATAAPFIKTGAVGGERTAKLNELIRIETNA